MKVLELKFTGQVHGGKNNYIVLRNGMHVPSKVFKQWRYAAISQVVLQKPYQFKPLENPNLLWTIEYTPSDRRRRDMPAIIDSLFHVIERTGFVVDDGIIKQINYRELPVDKMKAGVLIKAYSQEEPKNGNGTERDFSV